MAITPVQLPATLPPGHPGLLNTDFDRDGDPVFRLDGRPVEMYRFTGDGSTTSKTAVQSGFDRVVAGLVFNMTSGTYYPIDTLISVNASDPTEFDIAAIPASTDVFLVILWGDKTVAEPTDAVNQLAPSTPDKLTGVVDSATQVTLTRGTSYHPSLAITGYQYKQDSGSWTAFGAGTTKAVTGLTTATTYAYQIRSYVTDAFGNITYSDPTAAISLLTS